MAITERTEQRAQLAALVEQKIEDLARARDAAELTQRINAYAALQARLHRYSFANMLLIEEQLCERGRTPTHVAGYHTWLRMNRVPAKGTGLAIFAPAKYRERDEETGEESWQLRGFRVVHVFDAQDTTVIAGRPDLYAQALPRWTPVDGDFSELLRCLLNCARARRIRVEIGPGEDESVRGWSSGTGNIWLNSDLSSGQMCGTLLHELSHELCHDLERRREARQQMHGRSRLEMEAEAAAFCLAGYFDLPRPDAAQYVALHGIAAADLRRSLEAIRSVVATVLGVIEDQEERM